MKTMNIGLWILTTAAALTLTSSTHAQLSGTIKIDGSSTVEPIISAAAEMFQEEAPKVKVPVGISGTGGGFKKFLDSKPDLRTDITNASRHIKPTELQLASSVGVEFIEVPVGMDGMSVVVHPSNKFCDHLTLDELKKIWEPGSTIKNWNQVRAGFPDLPLKLYGPGTDSGTFDYFTEAVVGKEKASRSDYTASENDNVLVQGVSGDPGSLGYFGFAYYEANQAKLKLVAIDNGDGKPIKPSLNAIRDGSYHPLSRPLFVYVNKTAAERPEVAAFLNFFLDNAAKIVEHPKVGYVSLSPELYAAIKDRVAKGVTGTAYAESASVGGKSLEALYGAKK